MAPVDRISRSRFTSKVEPPDTQQAMTMKRYRGLDPQQGAGAPAQDRSFPEAFQSLARTTEVPELAAMMNKLQFMNGFLYYGLPYDAEPPEG